MEAKSSTSYLTVDDVIMPRGFPLYSIKIQTECADQFSSGLSTNEVAMRDEGVSVSRSCTHYRNGQRNLDIGVKPPCTGST